MINFLAAFLIFISSPVQAHPGRTDEWGCHVCRTHCDYWGEAWYESHCHDGYTERKNTSDTDIRELIDAYLYESPTPVRQPLFIIPSKNPPPKKTPIPYKPFFVRLSEFLKSFVESIF